MSPAPLLPDDETALFTLDGPDAVPHDIGRGPWDHGFLHGGAVCGLAAHLIEDALRERLGAGHGLAGCRLTVEILSMVPVRPLTVAAEVVKPGRRAAVATAEIRHEGRVVARASSTWGGASPTGEAPPEGEDPPPARPEVVLDPGAGEDADYPRPGFNCDAVELRPLVGTTEAPGPGLVWVRLRPAVVTGRAVTPVTRAAAVSDLGIAVGWDHSPSGGDFINADVTLQLVRPVRGEWLLLDSRIRADRSGTGFCDTVLSDDGGVVGRVLQTTVEAPVTLGPLSGT